MTADRCRRLCWRKPWPWQGSIHRNPSSYSKPPLCGNGNYRVVTLAKPSSCQDRHCGSRISASTSLAKSIRVSCHPHQAGAAMVKGIATFREASGVRAACRRFQTVHGQPKREQAPALHTLRVVWRILSCLERALVRISARQWRPILAKGQL